LLTRFLQKKSFIDVELPQIRVERISDKDAAAFGVEPTAVAATPMLENTMRMNEIVAPGPFSLPKTSNENFMVALVSMLIGFSLAMLLMRRPSRRNRYEPVPNAQT
jgi:hypothetical protein